MKFWQDYLGALSAIVKDRTIFLTMVLSVIFYSFFYPFAYKAERPAQLPIVIVDEEKSPLSKKIINTASQVQNISIAHVDDDFLMAQTMVQRGQADAILFLPDNLSQSIHHGEVGGIGLYLSSAYFLRTQTIGAGLVSSLEAVVKEELDKFTHISHKHSPPLIHQSALFNPMSGYGSYIFPAVAPLIVHQTILLGLCMLIGGYRERGWRASLREFLAIFLAALTLGVLSCFYLFGFAFWWHDYPRGGNFWGMLLAVPIFVGCVASMGLLLASFLDSAARAGVVFIFTSIPLFLLTGLAYPLLAMPVMIQTLSWFLPSTHGVQLFVQLNQMGVPVADILPKLVFLFVVMVFNLCWAFWRLRRI